MTTTSKPPLKTAPTRTGTTRRKPHWSDEQREAARQRAHAMIREGKFGGATVKGGGRPRKRAPLGRDLVRVLDAEIKKRHPIPRQLHALDTLRPLASIAHVTDFDREHFNYLLHTAIQRLVDDGQLAPLALLVGDDVNLFYPTSREQKKRMRDALEQEPGGARIVIPSDVSVADIRRYDDKTVFECVTLSAVLTTRELLGTALNDALMEIVRSVVLPELAKRRSSDPN